MREIIRAGNASMKGFWIEQLCLACMSRLGLQVDPGVVIEQGLQVVHIDNEESLDVPAFQTLFQKYKILYIPKSFNFKAVDGIIVVAPDKKTVKIFPIQITIARSHSESVEKFKEVLWPNLKDKFKFEHIEIHFVWLVKELPFQGKKDTEHFDATAEFPKLSIYYREIRSLLPDLDDLLSDPRSTR